MSSKHIVQELNKQRLQLKQSKNQLKRKFSVVSFESSPLGYRRRKIDDLGMYIAEQRLERSRVDVEHQDQSPTGNDLNQVRRVLNHRICELQVNIGIDE
jgi:hypothetical protein